MTKSTISDVSQVSPKKLLSPWQRGSIAVAFFAGVAQLLLSTIPALAPDALFKLGMSTIILASAVLAWLLIRAAGTTT